MRMADRNKDGVLCLGEFLHYCEEKERHLWHLFQKMDSNRDGERRKSVSKTVSLPVERMLNRQ